MAFVALAVVVGHTVGTNTLRDDETGVGESGLVSRIVASGNFPEKPEENILVTARNGPLNAEVARAAVSDLTEGMRSLPQTESVGEPIASADRQAVLVPVVMTGDTETADQRVDPLLSVSARVEADHPSLRIEQVGTGSTAKGLTETLGEDFARAEFVSVPLTLLILLAVFGALVAASVPVVVALTSVGAAIGLSSLASQVLPATSVVSSVILLMGMAVGVDYSLFYLSRQREELRNGASRPDAVRIAAETSGHTVVVSGVTVIVAMAGLYLAGQATFTSLATGSIIVVAVAVLASLTVVPALLATLGGSVDRLRVPVLWRLSARAGEPRIWPRLLLPSLRHPAVTLVLSVGLLLLLAAPALSMKLKQPGADDLPRDIPAVQALDHLSEAFPSEGTTHVVAVRAPAGEAPDVRAGLLLLAERVRANGLFAHDREPDLEASGDDRVHVLTVGTPFGSRSEQAATSLRLLRSWLPEVLAGTTDVELGVGGKVGQSLDFTDHLEQRAPWVFGFVLTLTFLAMFWAFRSPAIALTAVVLNLLSAAAAFGVLVGVFQYSWAESALDFYSSGAVVSWLPLFLFAVLFGLSMDYHVFVVGRIREAAAAQLPLRAAIAQGITRSAGVVTSAAVVMVGVFSIFGTLSLIEFKQLGVGLAAAILIDAVVIRVLVLPAAMALLGPWNWWPGRLSAVAVGRGPALGDEVTQTLPIRLPR
ncbi:MMPL family transporter [Cryptosporangium arvum]|uniref:MMPL family transporter n=1 Tax=Cryptosporangium arvum TaxID=80871 RepID=UPI0004B5DFAE|nr:MMPL family transporter [Cryptosporangium arvum]